MSLEVEYVTRHSNMDHSTGMPPFIDEDERDKAEGEHNFDRLYIEFIDCNYQGLKEEIVYTCVRCLAEKRHINATSEELEKEIKKLGEKLHETDDYLKDEFLNEGHRHCSGEICELWAKYVSHRGVHQDYSKILDILHDILTEDGKRNEMRVENSGKPRIWHLWMPQSDESKLFS